MGSAGRNSVDTMTAPPPDPGTWTSTHPAHPTPRSRIWSVAAPVIALALATAALIVALIALARPADDPPAPTTTPTYTAAQTDAAHQRLCEVYQLAARSVQIETHSGNQALAGVATVNGALMLEQAVSAAPALAPADRSAALTLAEAYTRASAMASSVHRDDPEWQAVVDDVNAKDARMKAVCRDG